MLSDSNHDPSVQRELERHPTRTVAVVWLVDDRQCLLVVRTKRLPNQWQPIGGGVKSYDATVEAAALREIREETGLSLTLEALRKILETPYDFGQGTVHFYAAGLPAGRTLNMDMKEIEEHRWVSLAEAAALPMFPATIRCLAHLTSHPELLSDG